MAFNPLRGVAQSIVSRTIKRVNNSIPNLLGLSKGRGGSTADGSSLDQTKFSTKNFSFPLDIGGPVGTGNQGHYIMFMINQQTNAKLGFGNAETNEDGSANMTKEANARKIPSYLRELTSGGDYSTKANQNAAQEQINAASDPIAQRQGTGVFKNAKIPKMKGSTLTVERPPTVRMDTAITLYMPQSVTTTYGVEYADQQVGDIASAGVNAFRDVVDNNTKVSDAVVNAFGKAAKDIEDTAFNQLINLMSIIPGIEGAKDVFFAQRGFIKAPKMELFFRGIGKRKFQFQFRMIPKSRQEMQEIRKIVASFKLNMLPEFVDGDRSSRRLTIPNTFDIRYMYNNVENDYLHKISTCVLETMTVNYSGEGKYQTFEGEADGAPPLATDITLNFQEMEIITKERVAEGF